MKPETELFELVAREAAGEIDAQDLARLEMLCASEATARSLRSRFASLLEAAKDDDTADAPGQTLHRAYQIMERQRDAASVSTLPAAASLLRLVFDSLCPAAGLRSTGTARRQLMLESDGVSVDIFIDRRASDHEVSVMFEGLAPERVVLVTGQAARDMARAPEGWRASVPAGRAHLVIRAGERTIASEPFEIE